MDFALAPSNGGPPRLWRYVEDEEMTTLRIVSKLEAEQNLLIINRALFDQLDEMSRHQVLRTHAKHEYV